MCYKSTNLQKGRHWNTSLTFGTTKILTLPSKNSWPASTSLLWLSCLLFQDSPTTFRSIHPRFSAHWFPKNYQLLSFFLIYVQEFNKYILMNLQCVSISVQLLHYCTYQIIYVYTNIIWYVYTYSMLDQSSLLAMSLLA